MSGFGGSGFGGGGFGANPNPNPNANNANPFGGGGFGSGGNTAPGGFGAAPPAAAPPFGGGGFGGGPPAAFGAAAAPSGGGGMSFGASPNVVVAPSGGGGFGGNSNNRGFGSSRPTREYRSGFGSAQPPPSSSSSFGNNPFGGSSSSQPQPQPPANSNPFGGGSGAQQTFGGPSQPSTAFGGPSQPSAPFGGPSQSQSFGGPSQPQSSTGFGGPSQPQQQQQSSVTFGSSANVMVNNSTAASAANSTWSRGGSGGSTFGNQTASTGGFGGGGGFGQASSETKFGNSSSNNPFGGGTATTSGFGRSAAIATIPEHTSGGDDMNDMNDGIGSSNNNDTAARITTAQAEMEEKKRLLKAKIEEKKRRLAEKQQQKKKQQQLDAERARSVSPTPPSSAPVPPSGSLAERNAQRFAKHHSQQAVAAATRSQSPVNTTSSAVAEREDLKHAVNLVGLCRSMCPDDELKRRQNESDIQALEIPLPGQLHPPDWTIKDTAIKRFRRSAADYKLDVPEWVRPPEVLERTLGYLEEWILERDRQGPDPRFPNKEVPPPPLDVYQFVWDRTRMIRKDFILQNYVGTGGRCDAKAVRCHERIARWHAMCEHQLSHIDDYVRMQSQQNMQELGQTMKTLNSFYDDAWNRSTKEVPDEKTGRETFVPNTPNNKSKNSNPGGCLSDIVQGKNPIDYNGTPLNNQSDNPNRLIGANTINQTTARGTAEPEMRGLYMLMILENEGGMEVLKYAAKLFKERPAVYHSPPVQLALTIFKAWKDMNYVKFFSILRSPNTPYLFSCIMFKHVEVMRKIALTIMSISYGARNKNTGEAMYDQYPLDRLVHLLCFEDNYEAKTTCEFYNLSVKEYTSQRTGEVKDIIFWKASKFRIPKDPEKGHTLRLQPRKMMRAIESKLKGTTRLGVCRGDVSGRGASLSTSGTALDPSAASFVPQSMAAPAPRDPELEAKARELMMKQKLEQAKLMKQAREQEEQERKAKEKLKLLEKRQREADERKRELEQEKQAELERRRQEQMKKEEEARRKRREEEERLRKQREEERARQIAAEKARKEAEEAARRQKELEEQRRREEEERKRLEMERRIAEEKRRKELEELERRRKEEEARRKEALRLELEAKRKREAEERRKSMEWQSKIDAATKVVLWHRWKRVLSRTMESSVGSRKSLGGIDPFYTRDTFHFIDFARAEAFHCDSVMDFPIQTMTPTSKRIIEDCIQRNDHGNQSKLAIADMVLEEVESISKSIVTPLGSRKSTLLLKVALICPETMDIADQSYASLLYHWISSCVGIGKVETATSTNSSRSNSPSTTREVRVVTVKGTSYDVCSTCDIALFVIPPHWSNPEQKAAKLNEFASEVLDDDIPRVAFVLNDRVEADQIHEVNNVIANELGGNMKAIPIINPSETSVTAFEHALEFAFRRVAKTFVNEACVSVTRIPAMHLATKTIRSILWQCIPSDVVRGGVDTIIDEDAIVECSRLSLVTLMDVLAKQTRRHETEWSLWPAPEFASGGNRDESSIVESYFTNDEEGGLPNQWMRCLDREFLQETYEPLLTALRGHFRNAYQRIVADAPITVQDDCASDCAHGQYRRCLEKSLLWMQEAFASSGERCYLYLPEGILESVIKDVVAKVRTSPLLAVTPPRIVPSPAAATTDIPLLASEDSLYKQNLVELQKSTDAKEPEQREGITATSVFSKRLRSTTNHRASQENTNDEEESSWKKQRREVPQQLSKTRTESESYTQKLERLLHGDETVDLVVGDSTLSRYLRHVPKPRLG